MKLETVQIMDIFPYYCKRVINSLLTSIWVFENLADLQSLSYKENFYSLGKPHLSHINIISNVFVLINLNLNIALKVKETKLRNYIIKLWYLLLVLPNLSVEVKMKSKHVDWIISINLLYIQNRLESSWKLSYHICWGPHSVAQCTQMKFWEMVIYWFWCDSLVKHICNS